MSEDDSFMVMMTNRDLKRAAAMLSLIAAGEIDDSDIQRVWQSNNKPGDAKLLQEMMQKNMVDVMKEVNLKRAEGN
jgi:hypothetical protein